MIVCDGCGFEIAAVITTQFPEGMVNVKKCT